MKKFALKKCYLACLLLSLIPAAHATNIIQDDFTGATPSLSWTGIGYACLTAGTPYYGATWPNCQPWFSAQDAVGAGALRLTNDGISLSGAVILNNAFPSNQGVQVTFTTYTYGGNSFATSDGVTTTYPGADGIGFYIMDGAIASPNIGHYGGALGYTCATQGSNPDGMTGGYLGLGIDEFGNYFLDPSGTKKPNLVGLKGYGDVSWARLNAAYPANYPSSFTAAQIETAVGATCSAGYVQNCATNAAGVFACTSGATAVPNYKIIPGAYKILPSTQPISNEAVIVRTAATPIKYALKITNAGMLDFGYYYNGGVYQPIFANQNISASNGPMPASFKFGFGASTGGGTNDHEITCFQASPIGSASSVGVNTVQSGQVKTGTQVYLAYYHSDSWWGQLQAQNLVTGGANGLAISSIANWDASCVLTGGGCPAMGTNAAGSPINTIVAQAPAARNLMTWNGSSGTPLEWASLSGAQSSALNSAAAGYGQPSTGANVLDWLRGGRSNEQNAGVLRQRTGVLGDIIDSSPVFVGAPSQTYPSTWADAAYGAASPPENAAGAQTYPAFQTAYAGRMNIVYNGANDGILHGFRTGSYTGSVYNSATNDGKEVLGYMPSTSLLTNAGSLANQTYAHNYLINATPGSGDVFYGGAWHTWLVGGMGTGGSGVYALDITDPSTFSEANAAAIVKGEWNASTISCVNAASCGSNLGNTYGTPIIRRLHNGRWAVIMGNGFGSSSGHAGVFIGLIDPSTGALSMRWIDTGYGSSSTPDGIAYVASADLDGDYVTDYLYAGDLQGNVWKFDLTSSNMADWSASAAPIYVAQDSGGNRQPITTAPIVVATNTGGTDRILVMFGTGQKFSTTSIAPDTYATGTQSVYGVWDWNLSSWNLGTTTASGVAIPASSVQFAALTAPQTVARTGLQQQTVTSQSAGAVGNQVLGYRSISANAVCWQGSASCASPAPNNQYGWYMDLPATAEQIVYSPVMTGGALILSTLIPPASVAGACAAPTPTGWTMAFNVQNGGSFSQNFFPDASGSFVVAAGGSAISGIRVDAAGSTSVVNVGSVPYLVTQTVSGVGATSRINPQGGQSVRRVTWEEMQ